MKYEYKKDYTLINYSRLICAIMVVAIHTIPKNNSFSFYLITLSRIAVPFFFMINGYFLYEKLYEKDITKRNKFINDYIKRIFILYTVWSFIYLFFNYKTYFGYTEFYKEVYVFIKYFLFIGFRAHLWFLSALCFSVIILKITVPRVKLVYLLIVSMVLYIFCLFGDLYYGLVEGNVLGKIINIYISLFGEVWNSFMTGLFFIIMGLVIKENNDKLMRYKYCKNIFILLTLFLIENKLAYYFDIARDNNTSLVLLLLVPCIFLQILTLEDKKDFTNENKFSRLSKKMSMTIYLIHPFIIDIVYYITSYTEINTLSNVYKYILFITVSILSIIISYFFEKISENFNGSHKIRRVSINS